METCIRPPFHDRPELIGNLSCIESTGILTHIEPIGKLKRLEPDKIYHGPREIYPSNVDQIIQVQGLRMPFDLIVHPGVNPIFPYEGEYVVLPDDDEQQVLPTEGKTLFENVIVEPIPYREVGNPVGGYTITIGT